MDHQIKPDSQIGPNPRIGETSDTEFIIMLIVNLVLEIKLNCFSVRLFATGNG